MGEAANREGTYVYAIKRFMDTVMVVASVEW